ncbi:inhibitor of growth protein 5-like [Schistocerca americana]|uniref:inhibitor of growth protein 5-like n=1 Tax=Schistocerca americana TaxID=7009 RepID=UPI001F4F875E|nr:inhibitor of growth protein 5-like [Schistocerca americana]XP_047103262.1 inhibitor of growth protein 5-like [Schistocerca piceifrons]XP_049781514.1 inhibitor of growth protein 5-like [Schistocerca cancellata]XP_049807207.1 inhibitor of growth protein 5-like [Schistocerca nitens]XP_049846969.1 inhibitor of growth protein 5-like [Schistocerca gregaria]XP_049952642.1 inhibitor of growth protein 5-like [Schistocerca serialis cubense]
MDWRQISRDAGLMQTATMTCALYLEHYLDSLEHLPIELQRNFTLMRDLDARAQGLMRNIDRMASEYLRQLKTLPPHKRKEQMNTIQHLFNKAKEYGDDKVQLAIQTYELVDKHIRRLDADLARFEAEIQDKALSTSRSQQQQLQQQQQQQQEEAYAGKKGRKKLKDKERKKRAGNGSSEEEASVASKGSRKKHKKGSLGLGGSGHGSSASGSGAGPSCSGLGGSSLVECIDVPVGVGGVGGMLPSLAAIAHPSDVLDMPVDPNEPTYCLCHQVSYGEMIGCDNPDCPIEWFHFACVGLVTKPKGKWFCPKCNADRKKK